MSTSSGPASSGPLSSGPTTGAASLTTIQQQQLLQRAIAFVSPRACESKLVKKSDLSPYLQCNTCDGLLFNAFQSSHGCRICGMCAWSHIESKERDPTDKSTYVPMYCPGKTESCVDQYGHPVQVSMITTEIIVTVDPATRRELIRLQVHCPNHPDCEKEMPLKKVDPHLKSCPYEPLNCEKCSEQIRRSLMDEHLKNECPNRAVTCSYCKRTDITYRDMQDGHLDLRSEKCCPVYKSKCPYCQKQGPFTRQELIEKHKDKCKGYPRACKFAYLGCGFYDSAEMMQKHENDPNQAQMHMDLMAKKQEEMGFSIQELLMNMSSVLAATQASADAVAAGGAISNEQMNSPNHQLGLKTGLGDKSEYGMDAIVNARHLAEAEVGDHVERSIPAASGIHVPEGVPELRQAVEQLMISNKLLDAEAKKAKETADKCMANMQSMFQKFKRLQVAAALRFENLLKLESMADNLGGIGDVSNIMVNMKEQVRKHEEKIRQFDTGSSSTSSGSITNRSALERQIQHLNVRLSEAERRLRLDNISFNGILIWKIDSFSRKKREAQRREVTSLYSQPFYTSRYGYKMCGRIYLNGDGSAENNHVSLFFVVMKGDYDDLLTWPFSCKVTLMALDIRGNGQHKVDTFKPDPGSSSFMRPSNDMNIASGCPRFMSHTELDSGKYVSQEDCLYIKIIVDTTDLANPDRER